MDRTFEVGREVTGSEKALARRVLVYRSADEEKRGRQPSKRRANSCQSVRGPVLADPSLRPGCP